MGKKNEIHICAAFKRLIHTQRHTQTESKEIGKKIIYIYICLIQREIKRKLVQKNLCHKKIDFKIKTATRDKENHYTVIKTPIVNTFALNIGHLNV